MSHPLRVLIVEDNPHDTEFIVRALRRAGYEPEWQNVETEPAYLTALAGKLDLILSDYALPEFNGLRALELLSERGLAIPFIIVSATIDEETAVAAMKRGAADYLIKDRLTRLGPAVEHALGEARLRRERLEALSAQRESERLAHAALDGLSAHIAILDETGTVLAVNEAWRNFAAGNGAVPDRVGPGSNYLAVCDRVSGPGNETARSVADAIRAALTARQSEFACEYSCHAPGAPRWFVVRVTPFSGDGPRRVVVAHEDITARRLHEQALRESETRFRQVVENIHEVFWMSDVAKQRILYVSPGYEAIWGQPCESLYASSHSWSDRIHEDDRDRVVEAAKTKQVLGTYDESYRVERADGTIRWVHDRAFPVKNAAGAVTRIVGVAEDVTQRKQLEEQFLRAQRMEAIGTLAGGIAHDLNNILAPMLMVAPLLKGKLPDERDLELLTMVEQGAQRGASIIRQLLTFSRGIEGERGIVQVRHLMKDMVAIMRETFPREIMLEERLPSSLWPITADATQVHQVLMNLCVNARDAMRSGGKLGIRAENISLEERDLALHPEAKCGPYVRLTISDTGEGISRENLVRIFEPFFTTKAVGKGTGLGLSTVLGIVKSHGGFLTVVSEPGQGSTFNVHLPANIDGHVPGAIDGKAPEPGQRELILVVDDEASIRHTLRLVLEGKNYRTLIATDGREAVALFMANRDAVRLVLTDIMMPGMSGVALIRALRALEPQLPIVAMSGMHDQDRREELAALEVKTIIAKPCEHVVILQAVQHELASG